MKRKIFLSIPILFFIFVNNAFGRGGITCSNPTYYSTESVTRNCIYNGKDIHSAYQSYNIMNSYFSFSDIPNKNIQKETHNSIIKIEWKNKNEVSILEEGLEFGGGAAITLKKSGNIVKISEVLWTP